MRSVTDRFATDEADHLGRLVHHAGALGDGKRQRPVLPHEHLDAAPAGVRFGKSQELGPSPG